MTLKYDSDPNQLSNAEMRIVAEVTVEMARTVTETFDTHAMAQTFTRAALKDADFKRALVVMHRSISIRHRVDPNRMLAPMAPLFRELERKAEKALGLKG
jgi:hypothetical protein